MNRSMGVGIANGIAAGALWGVVFLAPAVLSHFSAVQLSAGRYLVYGLIAVVLLAPAGASCASASAWPNGAGCCG